MLLYTNYGIIKEYLDTVENGYAMETGVVYEANGLTSDHDVEIFRAWKRTLPGYVWTRAVVNRFDGLTLYTGDDQAIALHFAHALCGYEGSGPHATAVILDEAGFGEMWEIRSRVNNSSMPTQTFTK